MIENSTLVLDRVLGERVSPGIRNGAQCGILKVSWLLEDPNAVSCHPGKGPLTAAAFALSAIEVRLETVADRLFRLARFDEVPRGFGASSWSSMNADGDKFSKETLSSHIDSVNLRNCFRCKNKKSGSRTFGSVILCDHCLTEIVLEWAVKWTEFEEILQS